MTTMNRYFFEHDECTSSMRVGIILSFTALTLLNIAWTVWKCRVDYVHYYPQSRDHWKYYATVQALVATVSFYSMDYYVHKGVPFNCFFQYNEAASETMFYLSFALITVISYLEHHIWKKIPDMMTEDTCS
jgi:hypothetical protein